MRPANLRINYSTADGSAYTTTIMNNPGIGMRNALSIFASPEMDSTSVVDLVTPDGHMTLLNKNSETIHTNNIEGVPIHGAFQTDTFLTYYSEAPIYMLSLIPMQNSPQIFFVDVNAGPDGNGTYGSPFNNLDDAINTVGNMDGNTKTFYIKNGNHVITHVHNNTNIIGLGNNIKVDIDIPHEYTTVKFMNIHTNEGDMITEFQDEDSFVKIHSNDDIKNSSLIGNNIHYIGDDPEPQNIIALGSDINIEMSNSLYISPNANKIIIPGLSGVTSGVPVFYNNGGVSYYHSDVQNVSDLPTMTSIKKLCSDNVDLTDTASTLTHMLSMCKHLINDLNQLKNDYAVLIDDELIRPKKEAVDLFCSSII